MTLDAALVEISKRAPVYLNVAMPHAVGGQQQELTFADNHLFAVELPAWTLRAIVANQQQAVVPTGIGQDST